VASAGRASHDRTIEWITEREAEQADKPWFVWLAFNLSHATISSQPSQMAVPNADTLNAVVLDFLVSKLRIEYPIATAWYFRRLTEVVATNSFL
jgi:membrane-anchored protein YejM (alkaline phosphatase superfamily)